jgi:site-specific recombinase XerD
MQYKREPLTELEADRLRAAPVTLRDRLIVDLFLETGIRVSELAELTIDRIDWQARRLTVYGKGRKGNHEKRRVLPLSDVALRTLSKAQGLLNEKGRWTTARTIQRRIKYLANKAAIARRLSPHVCRHTFAVSCLDKGIDPRTLQSLLGHESLLTTQIYTNMAPKMVEDIFRRHW